MKLLTVPALAVALALTGGLGTALAADYTMRISHVFPPTHPLGKLAQQYKEAVEAETGGRVAVELLGTGQAFNEREAFPAVARGQIEGTILVSLFFSGIVPEMDALSIPFVVRGKDAPQKFLASEARTALDKAIRAKRVEPLAWLFQTNVAIFTSKDKPILTPADFQGLKMRGLNKVADAGLIAVGATPLSTPGSEVYQALQTGVLDAAITGLSAALARKYYEVQNRGTVVDNFITAYGVLFVNPAWYEGLPEDVREQIARAGAKVEAAGIAQADEYAAIPGLEKEGMTITVLTDEEVNAWAEKMTPAGEAAYIERVGETGKAVLEAFGSLR